MRLSLILVQVAAVNPILGALIMDLILVQMPAYARPDLALACDSHYIPSIIFFKNHLKLKLV